MESVLERNLEYLRIFIKKSDELSKYSYFEKGSSIISMTISTNEAGEQIVNFKFPNDEQKKALLLTLRMFWQSNDLLYYRKFLDFYLEMPSLISGNLKSEIFFLFLTFN